MRRGIGVGHVQKKTETRQQMIDLGAQITAERVGQIADQLEGFEQTLRSLAEKHKDEIKEDPVIRARFRQLADSLGIDLISSKKNVFAGILGLGDFYYGLAGKVVEACIRERKFCGSYVPLSRVVDIMKWQYGSVGKNGKRATVTESDICMALEKLHALGDGYNVVTLAGVKYIQTTPDGVRTADDVPLLNNVLKKRSQQIAKYQSSQAKSNIARKDVAAASHLGMGASDYRRGVSRTVTSLASYCESGNIINAKADNGIADIPFEVQCVALTQGELESSLMWRAHRVHAVLERMVQDGSVWIDNLPMASVEDEKVSRKALKTATEVKGMEKVYWFVSLPPIGGDESSM